eukprot:PITA_17514
MSGDTVDSVSVAVSENELVTMASSGSLQEVGGVVQDDSLKLDDGFDEVLKFLEEAIDEDLSQASQEWPSMEGGLAANSEIKGADETNSKKQRKNLYRGIRPRRGRWGVEVRDPIVGLNVWVGTYDTPLEAALAYDAEAKRRRGKKARLNFPDGPPPKKSRHLPGRSASSGDAQGRNSNVKVSARFLNGVGQIFQSDSPLQSRSGESPIPGDMHISSVETPLVPFHDQVQGVNSENFMTPPLQSRSGESQIPGDMHISPVETPLVQFHDQVQGINSENFITPPLQSRSGDSPIPGDMHISSVETPLVPFHDRVQGINYENFISEFESGINSENISEFVSNAQSVENHIEFWNLNSDYNRSYFDDWCSPQGVDDVNTSSALSTTDLAKWANIIGISEGNNTTMVGNVAGQATMDIPEGILQNASSLMGKNVLQPQTSQATLKSNSIDEPSMDSFLASLQFPESTGHADTSGINISSPEEWNFDDEMSKWGF